MLQAAFPILKQPPWTHSRPVPQEVPLGIGEQAPSCPGTSHAMHASSHALSQQRSPTQRPEMHWPPWLQTSPFGRSPTHFPAELQNALATQSSSLEQLVAQASPSQVV